MTSPEGEFKRLWLEAYNTGELFGRQSVLDKIDKIQAEAEKGLKGFVITNDRIYLINTLQDIIATCKKIKGDK